MKPATKEAYKLLHNGSLALAQIERNGIRIDVDYLDRTIVNCDAKIKGIKARLRAAKEFTVWRKRYGEKTNLGSPEQLGVVLFNVLGHKSLGYTAGSESKTKKRHRTDEAALRTVDSDFVKDWLRLGDLTKDRSTYLGGIRREVVDGYLHPFYNLHTVRTFRSSSSDPNFQNLPIRDPARGRMIRQAFIARKGRHLTETDFKGIEVCVSACYNKDPTLIRYIKDPTTDMHRDQAMELFFLKKDQVDKRTTRDWSKNRFVFPQFYGSVYFQCAPNLWDGILGKAVLPGTEKTVRQHLKESGVRKLGDCDPKAPSQPGTFVEHVRKVERKLWDERFRVFNDWKRSWYDAYLAKGWFRTLTGFICSGLMKRNDAINYPIQGSAFHCLLWTLIKVQRWLTKNNMRTLLIGQIHDSILADSPSDELQDYLGKVNEVVRVDLPKAWPWIIVPMTVEAEVCEIGASWYDKKPWALSGGGLWRLSV